MISCLYVDIDDVVADTTPAIVELARARLGARVRFDDMTAFSLAESLSLDPAQYVSLMEWVHEDAFLGGLEPRSGAVEELQRLRGRGCRLMMVTGRDPVARAVTKSWLTRWEVPWDDVVIVDKYGRYPGSDALPLEALKDMEFDLAIEDSLSTARHLGGLGREVLLVDRPWNRNAQDLPSCVRRVNDWSHISRLIG